MPSCATCDTPLHRRPPGPRDDTPAGHRPGSLWFADGAGFVALQTAPGQAVWQARHFVPGVLDQLRGPRAVAAYGMMRLGGPADVGSCIDVVRPADGALATIGFGPDGKLDTGALARLLGDGTGRVVRWYDQSGHGHDATADLATAPAIALGVHTGGVPALVFEPSARRSMVIPPGMRVTLNECSVFACGRVASTQNPSVFCRIGAPGCADPLILGAGPPAIGVAAVLGRTPMRSGRPPTLACRVAGLTTQPDRVHVVYDEAGYTTLHRVPAGLAAGGLVGGDGDAGGNVELLSLIVLAGPVFGPGDANHDAVRGCQYRSLGVAPQVQDVYVADGDSITEGMGASLLANYVRQMEALLARPWRSHNCGLSGDTMHGRRAGYDNLVAPLFNPHARRNVLSIFAGTNDFFSGHDAAAVEGQLRAYCARARATGFKVVVATTLPRLDLPPRQSQELRVHNAFLREQWSGFCDGLADMAASPDLASPGSAQDRRVFVDGLHPTSLGYGHIAQIMADAVNGLQW